MKKIPQVFKYGDNHAITTQIRKGNEWVMEDTPFIKATEKVDGTNIRVTVRSGQVVRVEKRRNPSKRQKHQGIIQPWYVDASRYEPADQYIFDAVDSYDWSDIPDGDHNAEAYGEKIQGNPLNIDGHNCYLFYFEPKFYEWSGLSEDNYFQELKKFILNLESKVSPGNKPEGVVFVNENTGAKCKIRIKDFERYERVANE